MARILVVDGDEKVRSAYAEDLEREGHEVLTASTGFVALRLVKEHEPDIVITEVRLPGMDGVDLMGRILAEQHEILVILNSISAYYKENFLSWAADACLTKSASTLELRGTVMELLTSATGRKKVGRGRENPTKMPGPDVVPRIREQRGAIES